MFSLNAIDTNLDWSISIVYSLCVGFVFIGMISGYSQKRKNTPYAENREKAPCISIFSSISKTLFMSSMLITLLGYWINSVLFLDWHSSQILQGIGVLLIIVGYLKLNQSFTELGDNYSPSFDAYLPHTLVNTGHYQSIRHPVYLYNLFISFGLALSSGSGIVAINAIIGLGFLIRTITIEETYLKQHFSTYAEYTKNTWRLIPHIY